VTGCSPCEIVGKVSALFWSGYSSDARRLVNKVEWSKRSRGIGEPASPFVSVHEMKVCVLTELLGLEIQYRHPERWRINDEEVDQEGWASLQIDDSLVFGFSNSQRFFVIELATLRLVARRQEVPLNIALG
jgi:hypothetical protein